MLVCSSRLYMLPGQVLGLIHLLPTKYLYDAENILKNVK